MKRALSPSELNLLERLLAANRQHFAERVEAATLEAEVIDEFGSLKFGRRSTADVRQRKLPAEATMIDEDGVPVNALLFVCADELDELQIYKADGSPLRATPQPGQWKVT
jgi:hypothetical protein